MMGMRKSVKSFFLVNFKVFLSKVALIAVTIGLFVNWTQASVPVVSAELPDLVEKIMPSVVNISSTTVVNYTLYGMDDFLRFWGVPQERKQTSLGSGFLIDDDGYLFTNNHVVAQADEVVVVFSDKTQLPARIVGKDPKLDLALLQIKPGKNSKAFQPVRLGNSDTARIAEPVIAIGNPFGLQHTVTMGIVSAKNRTVGIGPLDNFIQTDAAVNPGNSGGPLFNLKGEVIGINTAIFSKTGQSGGVSFAIPINDAKKVLADLKAHGRVPRPWLGVLSERVTPQLARYYQLPLDEGVVIYNIVKNGPADKAGIRRGDIITSVNGQSVTDPHELERELLKQNPGSELKIKIQRGPKTVSPKIKLTELPPRIRELPEGVI